VVCDRRLSDPTANIVSRFIRCEVCGVRLTDVNRSEVLNVCVKCMHSLES